MSKVDDKILEIVHSRILDLKKLDLGDLLNLPPYAEEEIEALGKLENLGVWHTPTQTGEDLIVAQCKNTKFLGAGTMVAVGFVVSKTGEIRDAEDELMWDYR